MDAAPMALGPLSVAVAVPCMTGGAACCEDGTTRLMVSKALEKSEAAAVAAALLLGATDASPVTTP